ncbi:VOC family protein [Bhargavaea ginsengi]|uniref:VOC family protein n=1 Tax=Bhargavaea ginsengi TaxID=426757 RepID=UPI002041F6AA|nr:VOC family protein [Bhargavaea ginsengi]MCM3087895.1 VOC family protein [Bhargavaea ginsengi]
MTNITPFLMFQEANAEEAMNFYTSLFKNSEITNIVRYGPDVPGGEEGTVMLATFTLNGREFKCIDSSIRHQFDFTPSFSIFVDVDTEEEIDHLYSKLAEGGMELMALGNHGFSRKFGWVNDKYGVSWQINLP